jgi:hypothetical protein
MCNMVRRSDIIILFSFLLSLSHINSDFSLQDDIEYSHTKDATVKQMAQKYEPS